MSLKCHSDVTQSIESVTQKLSFEIDQLKKYDYRNCYLRKKENRKNCNSLFLISSHLKTGKKAVITIPTRLLQRFWPNGQKTTNL
jgi:hypothetical protein